MDTATYWNSGAPGSAFTIRPSRWAVVIYAWGRKPDPRRGYVCRECFVQDDGSIGFADGYHYGGSVPVRVYARRGDAEKLAAKMSGLSE